MYFLSYASTNSSEAAALVFGFRALGIDIWCAEDRSAIVPGAAFQAELEQRLLDSNLFLLLVGRRGVDRWVRLEVDVALARHVREPSYRIVPLLLPEVDPEALPPFLARFHRERLAGDVTRWGPTDFQALAQRLQLAPEPKSPEGSPFPGLEQFEERSSRFFFGRDDEIREALRELGMVGGRYRRWLHIEGQSGTGKSSFARAGIAPAVRLGWIEGGPHSWRVAVFRPGRYPLQRLARALTEAFDQRDQPGRLTEILRALEPEEGLRNLMAQGLHEGEGLLLVIDQLEELLTSPEEQQDEARRMLAAVACALEKGENGLHLVTTFRSDFISRLPELHQLGGLLNTHAVRYFLAPMKPRAIQAAVDGPSHIAGISWEEGLRERLLQDTGQTAESLPLMAHVLNELWKRRTGSLMTHTAYESLGGAGGALSRSADALLETLSEEERRQARVLLTSLVRVGRGSRDVRHILTRGEAVEAAGGKGKGEQLIARLSGTPVPGAPPGVPAPPRLLSASAERVDLIHEALIDRWKTLRSWIDEDRRLLERIEDTEHAGRGWVSAGKPREGLPGGELLAFYLGSGLVAPEVLRRRLTPAAREFVTAAASKDRQRRLTASLLKLVVALGIVASLSWWGLESLLGDPQDLFPSFGWGWIRASAVNAKHATSSAACGDNSSGCLAEVKRIRILDYEISHRELSKKGQALVRLELLKPTFLPAASFRGDGIGISITGYRARTFRIVLRDRQAASVSYVCEFPEGRTAAIFGLGFNYSLQKDGVYEAWRVGVNLLEIESVAIEVPIVAKSVNDYRDQEPEEGRDLRYRGAVFITGIRLGGVEADTSCRPEGMDQKD
jgi:hypothetical protein